jgi:hypothetical protein
MARRRNDADRQDELCCDAKERIEEDPTSHHQGEPTAVKGWHRLACGHEALRRFMRQVALRPPESGHPRYPILTNAASLISKPA